MAAPRRRPGMTRRADGPEFWSHLEGDGSFRLGFTSDAQRRLGGVVYFRGPLEGQTYRGSELAMTLESEKCVRQLTLPIGGKVVEVNMRLESDPSAINRDPYGDGWVCRIRASRPRDLVSTTERPPRKRT